MSEETAVGPVKARWRCVRGNRGFLRVVAVGGNFQQAGVSRLAHVDKAPNPDLRYIIGYSTLGAGLLSFRRGYDRGND